MQLYKQEGLQTIRTTKLGPANLAFNQRLNAQTSFIPINGSSFAHNLHK